MLKPMKGESLQGPAPKDNPENIVFVEKQQERPVNELIKLGQGKAACKMRAERNTLRAPDDAFRKQPLRVPEAVVDLDVRLSQG